MLGETRDPQAAPALRAALEHDHDAFLKLTLAQALVKLKDVSGYAALLDILKSGDSELLRNQAIEIVKAESGQDFGYKPERSLEENRAAIEQISDWTKKASTD
jgi:HEAT repeat protein